MTTAITFEKFITEISKAIEDTDTDIINNVTEPDMKYQWSCVKPNLTFNQFYNMLKPRWDSIVNGLATQLDECDTFSKLMFFYRMANASKLQRRLGDTEFRNLQIESAKENVQGAIEKAKQADWGQLSLNELASQVSSKLGSMSQDIDVQNFKSVVMNGLNNTEVQNIVLEALADSAISRNEEYGLDKDVIVSLHRLVKLVSSRSICWLWDLITYFMSKKYRHEVKKLSRDELIQKMRGDIVYVINQLKTVEIGQMQGNYQDMINDQINKLTAMHGITIEDELNKMIPDKLATLKKFFVKTISVYYNNIHPIVWAQILKEMLNNFFIEMPLTKDALYQFASKHLLLNSGPFILKILQQVRPVMPMELQRKYNLTKLSYPVMTPKQYNLILKKVVKNWDMYVIDFDKSASVGHVFIVHRADNKFKFVIKLAKPLSIAQSCWEFSVLNEVFPKGSCEQQFVHNMLVATGNELYSPNEVSNIRKANKIYTMSYDELFKGAGFTEKLTTVAVVDDVIVDGCWFGFAMTVAPGNPISTFVEGEKSQLEKDTPFRSCMHRCMDLLIYKFFLNIFQHGFYHGDLHAGNIYFSYELRTLTMIDFGAVGEINIFEGNPTMMALINIIMMSIFYNYVDLLDTMTRLVNSKCAEESKIDMMSPEYMAFRKKLRLYQFRNMVHTDEESALIAQYREALFNEKRVDIEKSKIVKIPEPEPEVYENPYDYLSIKSGLKKEPIIDNTEPLPYDINMNKPSVITSFSAILAMITEYYATAGVNIAIKFSEFYELLKAYVLIIGVLTQINYPSQRMSIIMGKILYDSGNVALLTNITKIYDIYQIYKTQSDLYKNNKKKLVNAVEKIIKQNREKKQKKAKYHII